MRLDGRESVGLKRSRTAPHGVQLALVGPDQVESEDVAGGQHSRQEVLLSVIDENPSGDRSHAIVLEWGRELTQGIRLDPGV